MNSTNNSPPRLSFKRLLRFFIVGTSFTLLFMSCSKDDFKTPVASDHDPKYNMYYKILSFIETMEGKTPSHPALLPRSGYSPNDVLDYIEGAMNLQYADPGLSWESYDERTDTFSIVLSSGYASYATVESLFENARDSASVHFYSISEPDRFPILFDAVNVHSSSSIMYVSVLSKVGKVHRDPTPFGEEDYWIVFTGDGLCDPADDNFTTDDAGKIMSNALNDYFQPYACVFYTRQTQVSSQDENLEPPLTDIGWGQDNPNEAAGDWIIDFRTFYSACETGTSECSDFVDNGIYCLDPDEMNYYFGSILEIYNDFTAETELQHQLTDINLYERTVGPSNLKSWECNNFFAALNYCDEGNDFPLMLPFCCN